MKKRILLFISVFALSYLNAQQLPFIPMMDINETDFSEISELQLTPDELQTEYFKNDVIGQPKDAFQSTNSPVLKELESEIISISTTRNGEEVVFQFAYYNYNAKILALMPGDYWGDIVIPSTYDVNGETFTIGVIYHDCFNNCNKLTSVTIPHTVSLISNTAFINTPALASIQVVEENPDFSSTNNALYNKNKSELICVTDRKSVV